MPRMATKKSAPKKKGSSETVENRDALYEKLYSRVKADAESEDEAVLRVLADDLESWISDLTDLQEELVESIDDDAGEAEEDEDEDDDEDEAVEDTK